ncbi:MAG: diguanylate cyclase domain-containing protein [Pseudanabaenaceae cyanobacterium]
MEPPSVPSESPYYPQCPLPVDAAMADGSRLWCVHTPGSSAEAAAEEAEGIDEALAAQLALGLEPSASAIPNPPLDTEKTILLVDDNLSNLKLLSSVLEAQGYVLRAANNGYMALRSAMAVPPDLILLDINMPDLDGYEVCRRLKQNPDLRDIPVIFISTLDDVKDKVRAFAVGGVDYITKPFQFEEVLVRVATHITLCRLRKQLVAQNEALQKEISDRQRMEQELHAANQELLRLSRLDGLTQIANRLYLDEYVAQEWSRARRDRYPLGILMCDIDRFKQYNDTYGHLQGDDCLRSVAKALVAAVRRPADLVARYGGEEFAVILPNTNLEGLQKVTSQIREQVRLLAIPHTTSDIAAYVTISLGGAWTLPQTGDRPDDLLAAADQALYAAKTRGRNCVVLQTL